MPFSGPLQPFSTCSEPEIPASRTDNPIRFPLAEVVTCYRNILHFHCVSSNRIGEYHATATRSTSATAPEVCVVRDGQMVALGARKSSLPNGDHSFKLIARHAVG